MRVLKASHNEQPPIPVTELSDTTVRERARQRYSQNRASAWKRISRFADGPKKGIVSPVPRAVVDGGAWVLQKKPFKWVARYVHNRNARRAVLWHLLSEIEGHDNLVIVAHSLGSLVVAGVVPRLPKGTRVPLLITIGSPLRLSPVKHVQDLRDDYPYEVVDLWLNLYDPRDNATLGRGLSRSYRAALDVKVDVTWSSRCICLSGAPSRGKRDWTHLLR